jgi:NNP family nitrate/nitrite transporter-like MFS transporter
MSTVVEPLVPPASAQPQRTGRWIRDWRPEDPAFWAHTGARVARRNLVYSILCEHIGFSVWSLWSVMVLFLGPEYGIDPAGKFVLTAVPALVGSLIRLPYTYAVARFGGRNWTVFSAAVLLAPCLGIVLLLRPGVSYTTLVLLAAIAGVGGGNFSSSMANINAFYPDRLKGWALGINAGGGNIGVAAVQLVGLAVLAAFGAAADPRMVAGVYIPLIVVAALLAAWRMDNLAAARNDKRALRDVLRYSDTWVICLLYIGTFGSFIGFGFAFGQVLLTQFTESFPTPVQAASLTFLGPLIGSLSRPVGGWLSDRLGGGRVTLWTFVAMAGSAGVVLLASRTGSLPLFVAGFVALFLFSGVGNGSTYKMIPAIFAARTAHLGERARDEARRLSGALIGLAGAVGALGGVLINVAFRQSFLTVQSGDAAYVAFIVFYLVCVAVTWLTSVRPPS